MKRQLCVCALFALLLVPDWASACWPRWGGPAYYAPSYEPAYYYPAYEPVYYAPPVYCQPVYVAPCAPALQPPRVEPTKPQAAAPPARAPRVEPVRPAAGVEAPKAAALEPPPVPPEQKIPPTPVPKAVPEPKAVLDFPKPDAPPPAPPAGGQELPLPPLVLPDAPKLPGLDLSGVPAVPVPAPAPDALPPLTLPPDTPVARPTEAKSSPLAAAGRAPAVSVFPAAGTAAGNLRKVGFYNHTDRDLALTIEGKAVTLPAKTYRHAQLPPTFTWKHGDEPAATQTVPADAAGVDVVFRP